jgi:hypothetical protein
MKNIFSTSGVSARVRSFDPRPCGTSRRAGRVEGAANEHDARVGAARIANDDIVAARVGSVIDDVDILSSKT